MGKTAFVRIQNKSSQDVNVSFDDRQNVQERGLDNLQGTLAAGAQFPAGDNKFELVEGEPTRRIHRDGHVNVLVSSSVDGGGGGSGEPSVVRLFVDRSHWWSRHGHEDTEDHHGFCVQGTDGTIVLSTDIDDEDEDNEEEETRISIRIFDAVPTADWMQHMAANIADKPLCNVAMPGTHDSATYAWNKELGASPDSDLTMTIQNSLDGGRGVFGKIGSRINDRILELVYERMCKCQDLNITEQLQAGIRYLDLRVAWNEEAGGFFSCHGVYCVPIADVLDQIATFLKEHEKEIVLLDFNHFYALQPEHHTSLAALILEKLGDKLAIRGQPLEPNSTVQEYWDNGVQAVAVYHDDATHQASESQGKLWFRGVMQSPWPNKNDTRELHENLQGHIEGRKKNKFFVLQGILTPDGELMKQEIMESKGKTSIKSISSRVSGKVVDWVGDEWQQEAHNVVIVDFFQDCGMVFSVLHLNKS